MSRDPSLLTRDIFHATIVRSFTTGRFANENQCRLRGGTVLQARTLNVELEVCDFCGGVFLKGQTPEECKLGWPEKRFQRGEEIITSLGLYDDHQRVGMIDARGIVADHYPPTTPVPELEFCERQDFHGRMLAALLPKNDHRWLIRIEPIVPERENGTLRALMMSEVHVTTREATLVTRVRCILKTATVLGGEFGSYPRTFDLVEGKNYALVQPVPKTDRMSYYRICDEQGIEGEYPSYMFEIAETIPDPNIQ